MMPEVRVASGQEVAVRFEGTTDPLRGALACACKRLREQVENLAKEMADHYQRDDEEEDSSSSSDSL